MNLSATVSGLPTGAQVTFDPTVTELTTGQTITINMTVTLISTASSGVHSITVNYGSLNASASLSLELQIADSVGLTVNSVTSSISAGPLSSVDYIFEVTNLGSSQDTFFIELGFDNSNNASNWYDIILSTTSINLDSSSTQAISVSLRERSIGAPSNGVPVNLIVTSTNDETVFDSSHERGEPISFQTGLGQMIPGFESAVIGMQAGEVKNVRLDPTDAYGEVIHL